MTFDNSNLGALFKNRRRERQKCGACGVSEGELHELGCDQERCPCCGNQLIGCDCFDHLLKLDHPPGTVWCKHPLTLTKKQWQKWERLLSDKGRVPFIEYPTICAKCGVLWPELFMVPDEEWNRHVEIKERDKVLCKSCYGQIRAWIDNAAQVRSSKGADPHLRPPAQTAERDEDMTLKVASKNSRSGAVRRQKT